MYLQPGNKKIIKKKKKKRNRVMTNERKILLQQQCLKREVKMSIRNTKNFRHKWREMMMKVQMPEMKQDVIIKRNIYEHTLDNKNYWYSIIEYFINVK